MRRDAPCPLPSDDAVQHAGRRRQKYYVGAATPVFRWRSWGEEVRGATQGRAAKSEDFGFHRCGTILMVEHEIDEVHPSGA